jgi:putative transcriptional regulator
MSKMKRYKSDATAAVHAMMSDLYEIGAIDNRTMRKFDVACLTPIQPFTAEQIRELRKREAVSQQIFALYLGVSKDSISQWERGQKTPAGAALKLLSLVKNKGLHAIA